MTLSELLQLRNGWDDEQTIYVAQPWSVEAEAVVAANPSDTTAPIIRDGRQYDYFIEGFIARDFLDDLGASAAGITKQECERLIRYAIDDA